VDPAAHHRHARAAELFFTGDTIDAATALSWGLVSRSCLLRP
jgi:enoyl-CoA hydratase/carnithine racemase